MFENFNGIFLLGITNRNLKDTEVKSSSPSPDLQACKMPLTQSFQFQVSIDFCSRERESHHQKYPIPPNSTASSRASLSFTWSKIRLAIKESAPFGTPMRRQPFGAGHGF